MGGHICPVYEGRTCRCGNRGCVEAYVGVPGIALTLRLSPTTPSSTRLTRTTVCSKASRPEPRRERESPGRWSGGRRPISARPSAAS
ncbi:MULTISPECIES: ROK family protein [unclassified Streptomyces]|uniref:ROK family protein n=1 Tax=Streptomyces sp. NPDC127129 TaxID=3345373 RepID=UPI00362C49B1